jgi:hypothetical protein
MRELLAYHLSAAETCNPDSMDMRIHISVLHQNERYLDDDEMKRFRDICDRNRKRIENMMSGL